MLPEVPTGTPATVIDGIAQLLGTETDQVKVVLWPSATVVGDAENDEPMLLQFGGGGGGGGGGFVGQLAALAPTASAVWQSAGTATPGTSVSPPFGWPSPAEHA